MSSVVSRKPRCVVQVTLKQWIAWCKYTVSTDLAKTYNRIERYGLGNELKVYGMGEDTENSGGFLQGKQTVLGQAKDREWFTVECWVRQWVLHPYLC